MGVLSAEYGEVRIVKQQKFVDHRDHTVEVARASGTLQDGAGPARADGDGGRPRRVHLAGVGGEDQVDQSLDLVEVRVEVTRVRSEEHTSELQSRGHLVCRLLLERKT